MKWTRGSRFMMSDTILRVRSALPPYATITGNSVALWCRRLSMQCEIYFLIKRRHDDDTVRVKVHPIPPSVIKKLICAYTCKRE